MNAVTSGSDPAAGPRDAPAGDLVVTDAVIHATPSRTIRGDLWAYRGRITHAGPQVGAVQPDAEVIPAGGAAVVPLLVDSAVRALPEGRRGAFDLVPGNPATFAVIGDRVTESRIRRMLVVQPGDLLAAVVAGQVEARRGRPTRPAGSGVSDDDARRWHGAWHDPGRDMTQHLLPGGRYTETRDGRRDAWTGSYWVCEDRITYFDDTGFWAFGQLVDGVLHHAGFILRRT
ncbi:Atu4866 domain-containing protein [Myceligenerans pegani]|uniref:Atu4866 domain-containing protein n=1 Tax=Myceligenerans pegani TaxID=2776917 RepID=A0ABR9N571_9MICO|nr:Atu4866 domain-containing protein [Myceligenerans sp. TRM 65318]MBE1878803.1 Atu4866 domain-containing protein [Myceligenerans sp. TRM 65318]MBE3021074.1 Atu4866 domain-containing protein [Myceligenerans sp. TRM 65318]